VVVFLCELEYLVLVGGLDHAGNPTVAPFQDGARVEVGDAEIIKLEDSTEHLPKPALQVLYQTLPQEKSNIYSQNREK
jgi:hypothetical protein